MFDLADADLSLASLFAGWALADELQRRLAADGFDDLRFADGFVFQHLVGGPVTIGALAERLERDAAGGLEVGRRPRAPRLRAPRTPTRATPARAWSRSPSAGRRDRGRARAHRAALAAELGERLGPRRVEAARRLLIDVVTELGADAAVRGRSVRAPR